MSKMLKFKRYLTSGDAAEYLTKKLEEEITTLDVERLLLDGHIAASVITNEWHCFYLKPKDTNNAAKSKHFAHCPTPGETPDKIINGIYNIDIAELDSTNNYITIKLETDIKAACYEIDRTKYTRVISNISDGEAPNKSLSMLEKLQQSLSSIPMTADPASPGHAYQKPSISSANLVIKPADLEAFVTMTNDDKPMQLEKPLDYRERASMERIILILAKESDYDLSKPFKAAEILQAAAARFAVEAPGSKDTIAKHLKAAALHDTLKRKP
ncbi:hypothetical protein [Pseudomonas sp.]|uniref:hypothetical protein n=1 Tax=Pseudomonas sp. TaxID=306 RepID=UPI0027303AA3|nr:hypothetical protein [Pseudomonas sp.]MDP2243503.1 hypothetical protein [Pseudomonas sp.]